MNRLTRTLSFLCIALLSLRAFPDVASEAASSSAPASALASAPASEPASAPSSAPAPASASASLTPAESKPAAGVVEQKLSAQALAGKAKSQTCAACHGPDGNSVVPNWPKLAGQWQNYLVKELIDYRHGQNGPRYDPSMSTLVAALSDQDIHELAAFYASQTQTIGKTDPALLILGEKIYRGGDLEKGVTACTACHAPNGSGNEAAKFPRLGGQHALYIENQLKAFREGKRTNSPSHMMHDISVRMTDEQIKAVSSYIEGLH